MMVTALFLYVHFLVNMPKQDFLIKNNVDDDQLEYCTTPESYTKSAKILEKFFSSQWLTKNCSNCLPMVIFYLFFFSMFKIYLKKYFPCLQKCHKHDYMRWKNQMIVSVRFASFIGYLFGFVFVTHSYNVGICLYLFISAGFYFQSGYRAPDQNWLWPVFWHWWLTWFAAWFLSFIRDWDCRRCYSHLREMHF